MRTLNIIFMGTPDFACASFQSIHLSNHQVKAVVTVPDRKAGRGQNIRFSPVKLLALKLGIPILQPSNLKSDDFLQQLKNFDADLFVVVAFRMLPEVVWSLPKFGTINLHASLLPDYRGAAPINWAVINGDTQTGLSTFFIDKKIDTGAVIHRSKLDILPEDNAGSLHDKMMVSGAKLLLKTVDDIAQQSANAIPQEQLSMDAPRNAPKIFKADCEINWFQEATTIHNKIRGLSPYPTAWTKIKSKNFKIFGGNISDKKTLEPGVYKTTHESLFIGTQSHDYQITILQMEGKKKMNTDEFLRGMSHFFMED